MLVIRLARGGKCKKPVYRIVVTQQQSPRDGRFVDRLGFYNPIANRKGDTALALDLEKLEHWMARGAQPSDAVKRLIKIARNKADAAA